MHRSLLVGSMEAPPPRATARNNVTVAIRVRPLIEREINEGAKKHWLVANNELKPLEPDTKVSQGLTYAYDYVFNEEVKTDAVYDEIVAPMVNNAFKGFNGTILCYGQTSSGKTHTLYGTKGSEETDEGKVVEEQGIIFRFADHLFNQIKADEGKRQYMIKVGLLEIYNEKVKDLLNSENPIDLHEKDGKVVPSGLEEETIIDSEHLRKVAERIQRERRIGETRMNKESSRSHTILRVTIESFDLSGDEDRDGFEKEKHSLTSAILHFVDLAGSEKQAQTGAEGDRLREAININKSLSTLSLVIKQLSEEGAAGAADNTVFALCTTKKAGPKSRFANFRDSKLTRLLQSTLSGEAYISMICNVTQASFEETKSTLNFAKLAKKIEVTPTQNICTSKSEYERKLKELQDKLEGKDKEMISLRRLVQNLQLGMDASSKLPFPTSSINDRRLSLCPSLLHRTTSDGKLQNTVGAFPTFRKNTDSKSFMSTDDNIERLNQTALFRASVESLCSKDSRLSKETQTDTIEPSVSTKSPQRRQPRTPDVTLRLKTCLSSESYLETISENKNHIEFRECEKITELEIQLELEREKNANFVTEKEQAQQNLEEQLKSAKNELKEMGLQLQMEAETNILLEHKTNKAQQKLKEELQAANNERAEYKSLLQQEKMKIADLESQYSQVGTLTNQEKQALEDALRSKDSKIGELQGQVRTLTEDMECKDSKIGELEEYKSLLQQEKMKIADLESQFTQIRTHINQEKQELEDTLRSKDTKIEEMEDQLRTLTEDMERKDSKIGELDEYKSLLQQGKMKIADLESQFSQIRTHTNQEKQALEDALVSKDSKIGALEDQLRTLTEDMESKDSKIGELEEYKLLLQEEKMKIADLESQFSQIGSHTNQLKQALEEALRTKDAKIGALEGQLRTLTEDMERKDSKIGGLEGQLRILTEDIETKDIKIGEQEEYKLLLQQEKMKIADLESQFSQVGTHTNQEKQALEDALRSKDTKIVELEGQMRTAIEDMESKNTKLEEIEAQLRTVNEEMETKDTKIEEMECQLRTLTEDMERKDSKIGELDEYKSLLHQEKMKIADLESRFRQIGTDTNQEKQALEDALRTKEIKIGEMEDQVRTLTEDRESKDTKIEEMEGQLRTLSEDMGSKDTKIEDMEGKLRNVNEDMETKDIKIGEMEDQVRSLTEDMGTKDIKIEKLECQLRTLSKDMESKDSKIGGLEGQLRTLTEDTKTKDIKIAELEEYKSMLQQEKMKMADLESQFSKIGTRTNQEKQALEDALRAKDAKIGMMEDQLRTLTEDMERKDTKIEEMVGPLRTVNEDLEAQLQLAKSKIAQYERKAPIMTTRGQQCDLTDEIYYREKMQQYRIDAHHFRSKWTKLEAKTTQDKEAHETVLRNKDTKIEEMEDELRAINEYLESKDTKIEEIEGQLRTLTEDMESKNAKIGELECQLRSLTGASSSSKKQERLLQDKRKVDQSVDAQVLPPTRPSGSSRGRQAPVQANLENVDPAEDDIDFWCRLFKKTRAELLNE